ncbi:hypothetical protein JVT61DRAFT_1115 [Boletus reticuloceps]|uniref:Uncharacterized protein n=1 Tax=Boletus reticuloceps TaxID=495285 RepID=A0A8I2YRB3_9AGAM|nr:hypothetical protein JVT61DRAFT_1115 [Boletus reticuloceps]
MTIQVLAPRDVQSTLNYHAPLDSQPPYNYVDDPPAGARENTLGLDISGFQFVRYPSAEKDFADEDKIKSAYYAEVEDILKKYAGAKRVFIFDHTIRRSPTTQTKAPLRGPVERVHVDQTFAAAAQRVEYHLGTRPSGFLKVDTASSMFGDPLPTSWPTNPLPWLTTAPLTLITTSSQPVTSMLIARVPPSPSSTVLDTNGTTCLTRPRTKLPLSSVSILTSIRRA